MSFVNVSKVQISSSRPGCTWRLPKGQQCLGKKHQVVIVSLQPFVIFGLDDDLGAKMFMLGTTPVSAQ